MAAAVRDAAAWPEVVELAGAGDRLLALTSDPERPILTAEGGSVADGPWEQVASRTYGYGLRALGAGRSGAVGVLRSGEGLAPLLGSEHGRPWANPFDLRLGDPCIAGDRVAAVGDRAGRTGSAALVFWSGQAPPALLLEDAFLAKPCLSPDGRWIAWQRWSPPHMPWERSSIRLARLEDGRLREVVTVSPEGAAATQPAFAPNGRLFYLCDADGPVQLWTWSRGRSRPVTRQPDDVGLSTTRQASRSWALEGGRAAMISWRDGVSRLSSVGFGDRGAPRTLLQAPLGDQVVGVGGRLVVQDAGGGLLFGDAAGRFGPGRPASPAAARLRIEAADGRVVHGWRWSRGEGALVVIDLHGGPTGFAQPVLPPALRALHDAGHGVVSLNYAGSCGFGRAYRDQLRGRWGLADVEDVRAAVDHLAASEGVARSRIVLRGASAGGFTVLNALTRLEGLGGGIVYYGVADLASLAATTHRFERHYLLTLVGARDESDPQLRSRSPLDRLAAIRTPLLLLHGADDEVTPVGQVLQAARVLEAQGSDVRLRVFPGEGHGFTRPETLAVCASEELAVLSRWRRNPVRRPRDALPPPPS